MKSTKKALFTSAMALVLCLSMLIGTTFAWFTDTDTLAVSNIVSGTLELEIQDAAGKEKTTALTFVNANGSSDILWEPGATFQTESFQLVNTGNLWLKYMVEVTGIQVSENKLNEAISFYLVDAEGNKTLLNQLEMTDLPLEPTTGTGLMYIEGHMDENAGNEYQGLTLSSISIAVYATQYTSEADSFGNQYDAGASYDIPWKEDAVAVPEVVTETIEDANGNPTTVSVIHISTPEQLAGLASEVNAGNNYAGVTVVLDNDIDLEYREWTAIGTSSAPFSGSFNGNGHTISNLKITKTIENLASSNRQGLFGTVKPVGPTYIQNVTLNGASVVGGYHTAALIATADDSSQSKSGNYLVVTNIKLTGTVKVEGWEGVGGVMASGNMAEISNITVDVEPGSYVSTTRGGRVNSFACVGSVKGGGYLSSAYNISSNMDVRSKTAGTGGLFGVIGGQTVVCELSNLSYTGTVTMTETTTGLQWGYGCYSYNGLLVGAPRFKVVADQATCTSTGKLELHTEEGILTSNDMGVAFTWGKDLFGASRDNTYTNKSYATAYAG